MPRLSRSLVIADIEFIVRSPGPRLGQSAWVANGADCSVERFSFSGLLYDFRVEILHVSAQTVGRGRWKLLIVTETWHGETGETFHASKWLKVVKGEPGDILKWIRKTRASVALSNAEP